MELGAGTALALDGHQKAKGGERNNDDGEDKVGDLVDNVDEPNEDGDDDCQERHGGQSCAVVAIVRNLLTAGAARHPLLVRRLGLRHLCLTLSGTHRKRPISNRAITLTRHSPRTATPSRH